MSSQRLQVLDLFSGIGGFSLALSPIAKTIAYCDIDSYARSVLETNMAKRHLDKAPIFNDVTCLDYGVINRMKPQLITAGFPCTDISSANPSGEGLKGLRSGLFREITKLVDRCPSIQGVFMENSPRIKTKGLSQVVAAFKRRGFIVRYTFLEALDVGAYHKRKRWYCLCYRPAFKNKLSKIDKKHLINKEWLAGMFTGPKAVRFESREERNSMRARCGLLGNAVVPWCARYAWNCLVGQEKQYQHHPQLLKQNPLNLKFCDGVKCLIRNYWATPVYSTWHNYASLTRRGSTLLSNQVYYFVGTRVLGDKRIHYMKFTANPEFVEYLMGYPVNWTIL